VSERLTIDSASFFCGEEKGYRVNHILRTFGTLSSQFKKCFIAIYRNLILGYGNIFDNNKIFSISD